jgi:hypothetical protein
MRLFFRLLKNGHLLRFPHPSSLQRTGKYASLLMISGALHLALFEQPEKDDFFDSLLELSAMELVENEVFTETYTLAADRQKVSTLKHRRLPVPSCKG